MALADVRAQGRQAIYFQQDISDIAVHEKLLNAVRDQLGPIACLVNNAGVTSMRRGDMLELTPESFDRCVSIDLRGTVLSDAGRGARDDEHAVGPARSEPTESIVTITSLNAEVVGLNRADYCMTKAALSMASKLFAARLAQHDIHVFEVPAWNHQNGHDGTSDRAYEPADRERRCAPCPVGLAGGRRQSRGDDRFGGISICHWRDTERRWRNPPSSGLS